MYFFIYIITIGLLILFITKLNRFRIKKNRKLENFRDKLLSKESKIEKIFFRQDEKTYLDPNINIKIDINENQENIVRKVNIHRARLAKYKKSKLNGEMLFEDSENNLYKIVKGEKIFID